MAGETLATEAIVLSVRPWSRTSHIVSWLTRDAGRVTTVVKGAVRPKSAFLGQYDLFYTCELVYYARQRAGMWIPREISPIERRDALRGRWRETSLAAYAAAFAGELAPPDASSSEWFGLLSRHLDSLCAGTRSMTPDEALLALARFETSALGLAGLAPDFRNADGDGSDMDFAIDSGRPGRGTRTVKISRRAAAVVSGADHSPRPAAVRDALRFLGVFITYHLERPAAPRRSLVDLLCSVF